MRPVPLRLEKEERDGEVGGCGGDGGGSAGARHPDFAQEGVAATGAMERLDVTTYQYGTHAVTDEASGAFYAQSSNAMDLDAYAGQRVTVYGTLVPGYEHGQIEGGPPLLEVTWVEPAPL